MNEIIITVFWIVHCSLCTAAAAIALHIKFVSAEVS
ncbi:hypothetical protein PE36_17280 [Moritella sp. PE36]|nr:hypothetical protein PE36_17280 [Moritella sp. PE36]